MSETGMQAEVMGVSPRKRSPTVMAKAVRSGKMIAFSLRKDVWNEKMMPRHGDMVHLDEVEKDGHVYWAKKARFWRKNDK